MKKQVRHAFCRDIYLLGQDYAGVNYWLEEPSWDCDWYWGFGYVETYTNNRVPERSKDIDSHGHFDTMFLKTRPAKTAYENFKEFFKETPLTDTEIWSLIDYMSTFYILRETANVYHSGFSYFTEDAKINLLKNKDREDEVNKVLLPELFKKIKLLLTSN